MQPITATINKKIIETTEKIIASGVPMLYFLVSVAFYLRTYDSAQIKITLIQIGGAVLLTAWLVRLLEEDIGRFLRDNAVIVAALAAFLLSGIVSAAHSPMPLASANELIRRVMYIGIALIAVREFNSEEKFRGLFRWLYAAAFVATIYGVVQFLDTRFFPPPPEPGLDPFIWRNAFGPRIFSTFGNPNFFGDFLVVMSPMVLALFLYRRRFHLLVLWVLIAFCVMMTGSKGAWLGFGAGLVIFVFLAVGFFLNAQKAKLRRTLLILMAAAVLIVGAGILQNLRKRPDSGSFRLFTWMSTWEMINTSPWIGTGIGTFYVTYPAWRRPQIFYIEGRHNTETDHPENEYLEVWYDEGLIGFGVFLWVVALFLTMGFRNLKTFSELGSNRNLKTFSELGSNRNLKTFSELGSNRNLKTFSEPGSNRNLKTFSEPGSNRGKGDIRAYYQLGLLTALAAQLVHNFVCVSLRFVSSGIFLWLLIGLIGALGAHNPLPEKTVLAPQPSRLPRPLRRILQCAVVAAGLYFVYVFYGFFDADINHNMAIYYSKQAQWDKALEHYTTVARENPSFIMAHYFMGNVYNDRWAPGDLDRAVGKYEDVWKLAPNYVQSHHQMGLIYLKAGEEERRLSDEALGRGDAAGARDHRRKMNDLWNKALDEFERYRTIDPVFPLNYYRMAWIYIQMGRMDKAEETYRAHLDFPKTLAKPPHNVWVDDWTIRRKEEYAETYVNLGNLRFMRSDIKGAEHFYREALNLRSDWTGALKNLAILYGRTGRLDEAKAMWVRLRAAAPGDPDVQRVFGAVPVGR